MRLEILSRCREAFRNLPNHAMQFKFVAQIVCHCVSNTDESHGFEPTCQRAIRFESTLGLDLAEVLKVHGPEVLETNCQEEFGSSKPHIFSLSKWKSGECCENLSYRNDKRQ